MNALAPIKSGHSSAAAIRRERLKQDARNRWWSEYARISEKLQAELDEIERDFWTGRLA